MAKTKGDKDKSANGATTTVVPTVSPDDPPPSAASPTPTGRPAGSATTPPTRNTSPARENTSGDLVAQVSEIATAPLRLTKRLLPGRTPAYLGAGALLVVGVIDLPALVAGGLAYEALRRWNPTPS